MGLIILFTVAAALPAAAQPPRSAADEQRALGHYQDGWRYLSAESYDLAQKEFFQAIDINPSFKLAYYGLGRSFMALKRFVEAANAYEKCRAMYAAQVSDRFKSQSDADRARQDDLRLIGIALQQRTTGNPNALQNGQVRALRMEQQRLETQQSISRSRDIGENPVPAFLSFALGSAYFRSGRLADAEREYKLTVHDDPKAGEAYSNLAVVYLETGRFEDAERAVKAAEKAGFRVHPGLKDELSKKVRSKK